MATPLPACFLCARPLEALLGVEAFEASFERCRSCHLIFRKESAQISVEEERTFYQTHQNDAADPGYRRFLSKVAEPLKARLQPGARGLDYGSGPAPALVMLMNEAGYPTVGYDPLFSRDESLLTESYDFVTCTEVVEHFRDPARDWARLFSLVASGGLLAVMTEWYRGQSPLSAWRYARDPTHAVFYSRQGLSQIAQFYQAEPDFPGENVCFFRCPASGRPD
jgi:hypothetical protein